MARGNEGKEYVAKKLEEAFGEDYIGLVDKKYYVWAKEAGQMIQIAIAMTCPKTPVEVGTAPAPNASDTWDFEDSVRTINVAPVNNEITEQEKQNIADLMARLGL